MIKSSLRMPLAVCAVLILAAILIAISPSNATAVPTTYTYTGNFFSNITDGIMPTGTFTTTMKVTGSFTTTSTLAANLPFQSIIPSLSSFSFNNGRFTLTDNTAEVETARFEVSTDASANILDWRIVIHSGIFGPFSTDCESRAVATVSAPLDSDGNPGPDVRDKGAWGEKALLCSSSAFHADVAQVVGSPGDWTTTQSVILASSPIPEPSTMLLLGFGLAGLGFFRRRKKAT